MNAVAGLAEAQDADLAAWVRESVAFPNGMVDRIAPATGERERAICRDELGIEDAWPVFCEDFIQWVLEDNFPADRPAFEEAGVQFVPDVTPFEHMKIRILNGGHALIAYPAGLLDIHFVHEGMQHPLVRGFLQKVEREEILPILPPVPDTDLEEYFQLIERRCLNPKIGDTIRRLCLDGSNRQPKFIIPSIADRLDRRLPVAGLALESALWCRYCEGTTDSGAVTEPNDPNWERLQAQARAAKADPLAWLAMRDIYGRTAEAPAFRDAFAAHLAALWADGTEATLQRYLGR
jgi:mannitol 2-dehydrogenase